MKTKFAACLAIPGSIAAITYYIHVNESPRSVPEAGGNPARTRTTVSVPVIDMRELAALRELARTRSERTTTPTTDAWDGAWLINYPGVDPSKPDLDSDGDGMSNHDEMLAGTDPFNGKGAEQPNRQLRGMVTLPAGGANYEQVQENLKNDIPNLREADAEERRKVAAMAATRGIPTEITANGEKRGVLAGFGPEGHPSFTGGFDLASADTSGVDELWPSGVVVSVSGWTTGGTGFNLTGGLSDPLNTSRPYPRLALWDPLGGVRMTHHQLNDLDGTANPRVLQYDYPSGEAFHASAVASVMAGSGASDITGSFDSGDFSRGIAYGAQVSAWDTVDFQAELSGEASTFPPLRAANNSYGTITGWSFDYNANKWRWYGTNTGTEDFRFGAYLNGASGGYSPRELDDRSYSTPYTLLVWAAGNDRGEGPGTAPSPNYLLSDGTTTSTATRNWTDGDDGGFDSMPPQGCAKNVLTVGAYSDAITGWDTINGKITYSGTSSIPATTSAGPTDDGRLKPDVVACGTRVNFGSRNPLATSSILFGSSDPAFPADNDYYADEGTSFAAPVATGTVALALQRRHRLCPDWENNTYPIRSSTLKALMIGTATDVGNAGPDFVTGYGLLNSAMATKVLSDDTSYAFNSPQAPKPHVKEIHLPFNGEVSFEITALSPTTPVTVTMAWTDPPGSAHAGTLVDPTTKRLRHDLDLRVYIPGTTTFNPSGTACYKPWLLNPDLTGKSAAVRGAAAVPGSLTSTNDDSTNNVEQVVIPSPTTSGRYIVKIRHKTSPTMDPAGQWLSLVLTGVSTPSSVPFAISGMTQGQPGTYALAFNSVPGGIYNVQGSSNLVTWTNLVTNISARADMTEVVATSPPGVTSYFWRISRPY